MSVRVRRHVVLSSNSQRCYRGHDMHHEILRKQTVRSKLNKFEHVGGGRTEHGPV